VDDFVEPEIHRLHLVGAHIDIIKRLSHGETEDMYARMSPHGVLLNRREVRTAKVLAYLLGWSLTRRGKPVPMSREMDEQARIDTIRALDPDRFHEIHEAIEAHEVKMAKEREKQKKMLAGSRPAEATSSSPPNSDGESPGFVN
jgi:hypothetical protein